MITVRKSMALAATLSAVTAPAVIATSSASAAQINDLCQTNNITTWYMYIDGSGGAQQAIPPNATVRILAYRNSTEYTIRYNNKVGPFPRSLVYSCS